MLDLQDEIESDLSVFHRIDDPMQLGSSRYFRLCERLHLYPGAVRASRMMEEAAVETSPVPVAPQHQPVPVPAGMGGDEVTVVDDLSAVVELTNRDGFLGIEYGAPGR